MIVNGLSIPALHASYRAGTLTPTMLVDLITQRIASRGDDGVWITVSERLHDDAAALDPAEMSTKPLWGVPFAIKDNFDVAGLPTTAACPGFAYTPDASAPIVDRLVAAGALLVGKTNLDQFATGLSGTRSPYGTPSSVLDPKLISGGSSSGSAVAVAAGLVSFALATDTAGSGRVPAALNGIVGLKPSIGLVSGRGMLPACRSLDCPSVMALSVDDAVAVLAEVAGYDVLDPWARQLPVPASRLTPGPLAGTRFGIPANVPGWGTRGEAEAWAKLCAVLTSRGATLVEIDFSPLFAAGAQLYRGAWLAERAHGLAHVLTAHSDDIHPVVKEILTGGADLSAGTLLDEQARMVERRRHADGLFADVDALLSPTVTTTFTIEEMLDDPIALNSALGTFTMFTNLVDLCAVTVPVGLTTADVPFSVSVQSPVGTDAGAAALAAAIERAADDGTWLDVAVVGAHLEGQPLHADLVRCGAVLQARTVTAPEYRLFALPDGPPKRPGLIRVTSGGRPIEVEIYRLPRRAFGEFFATVPAPLGLGTVVLESGSQVKGFICEPVGLEGASDITEYGGWRTYLANHQKSGRQE